MKAKSWVLIPRRVLQIRLFFVVASLVCFDGVALSALAEESSLTIGWALPLSGDSARYGADIEQGARLAQEELAGRGVKISFISEDTQLLPRVAASAAQKLIDRDKVDVVVSLWDTAEAVAPIAERKGIPHVSIRWNPRVAQEFQHTFTFESTYVSWVRATLEYLRSQGVRRIAILSDMSSAGWVMARESVLHLAAEYGLSIVRDVEFLGSHSDLNLSILKLTSEPADYFLMLQFGPSLVETMRRLGERKIAIPVIGYFDGMEPSINIEGRRFIAQFDTQEWFLKRFATRYSGQRPLRAAFGFDLVSILGQLLERVGRRPTSTEILEHLASLHRYRGATGVISANKSRNIETDCVLKEIRNGIGVRVLPLTP